jgi:hypothetical protein
VSIKIFMLALLGAVHEKENEMHDAARQKTQKIHTSLDANVADFALKQFNSRMTDRVDRTFPRVQKP